MGGGVHLHVASGFSARHGAFPPPSDLVARAAEHAIGTLPLTDRDNVTGTVRFAKAAMAAGVRPVFGVDLAVAPCLPTSSQAPARGRTPVRGGAHVVEAPLRDTLPAKNAAGWGRLSRIVSAAHLADGVPTASRETLQAYAGEDLAVRLGPASRAGAPPHGGPDRYRRAAARAVAGTGRGWSSAEGLVVRLAGMGPGSGRLAAHTLGPADRLGIPAVLGNAVRYADPGQNRLADVLDAARLLRPVDRWRLDCGERWLKGPDETAAVAERRTRASWSCSASAWTAPRS
ncbi:PHP domain-containing protein [Streptomyces sp. R-07]|uniref:PHP domain-containing protein n=1 Tax=Streptomyces sp. R-07 TaxID=3404052 RepID=UPI003CF5CE76